MTLIDGDRIVTAQLYDDEHEEFTEEKMSIIDYVNAYTDEGVTTADDVLDKIRAELHANAEWHDDGDCYLRDEWIDDIIDKYKGEQK